MDAVSTAVAGFVGYRRGILWTVSLQDGCEMAAITPISLFVRRCHSCSPVVDLSCAKRVALMDLISIV
jgi:hypothetical protein